MNRSRVTGDLASHGNIFVDIANDRVGIGSTIPGEKLSLPDSAKIALGNSADLKIYHDGSHSLLKNSTGYLLFAKIPPTLAAAIITILGLLFMNHFLTSE